MHNNPGSWMETLAKCNLLQYSTVKEKGDGHVSITITVLTDTEPKPCDEKSKEAASKILSLCEISAIWLTDNGGIALTSRYDGCTITINGIGLHYSHEENLDYEYAELDRRLSEISWTGGVFPRLACTTSLRKSLEVILRAYSFVTAHPKSACIGSTTQRSTRGTSLG